VRGRSIHDYHAGYVWRLASRYARVAVDLGTGDGRYVPHAAAERPETLVIGLDANAAAMADASRRAQRRSGLPNALFVVAAAEHPP
jgi:16S rRNA (adenine(1408)-N(1))-methyltransferase